uniref:Uncharacterized protein n=1 Tax=Cucumis melo TaxID=3656 RepID=A0A9I9DH21_CUCME
MGEENEWVGEEKGGWVKIENGFVRATEVRGESCSLTDTGEEAGDNSRVKNSEGCGECLLSKRKGGEEGFVRTSGICDDENILCRST